VQVGVKLMQMLVVVIISGSCFVLYPGAKKDKFLFVQIEHGY
jgi:hypothetical protein